MNDYLLMLAVFVFFGGFALVVKEALAESEKTIKKIEKHLKEKDV